MVTRVLRRPVARILSIGLATCSLSSCNRRDGLNFDCKWTADTEFEIALQEEAHVRHLVDDIGVTEELAVRYGDRVAGWRLVDTFGIVSRHGGLKDRDAGRLAQQRCTATLLEHWCDARSDRCGH